MGKEEDDKKFTALHMASKKGHEEIVKLLLNTFNAEDEKDKLIEYVMKEDNINHTALHFASFMGHEEIVKLLLKTFRDGKDILIEYVMKEAYNKKYTALHMACFNEDEKDKLIQYVKKEDHINHTAFHFASFAVEKHPRIINLLNNYMQ